MTALHHAGGQWTSSREASRALGIHDSTTRRMVAEAVDAGLVTVAFGPRNALIITVADSPASTPRHECS